MKQSSSTEITIGKLKIGGKNPIAIQSMTDTDTADVKATFEQIKELVDAGSELVRVTVMDKNGAEAIPKIKELMQKNSKYDVPLIGDFHFVGHRLLEEVPECAKALDKYRINPGNVGKGNSHDENFEKIIEIAITNKKPVRIGVNSGSLDEELFTEMMEKNAKRKNQKSDREVFREALVESAILSANFAMKLGLSKNKIVLSVKVSDVQDVIWCYEELAQRTDFCLHLGLTEAGSGDKGIVASTAALSTLLQQGIGDTIRVSLTPEPKAPRKREVEICKYILQTLGIRHFRPMVTSCPGCGRTSSDFYRKLAKKVNMHIEKNMKIWKEKYPGVENLKIAVMGCAVNGPGESKHADIGISLPGKSENPSAPVYIAGKLVKTLRGEKIAEEFLKILEKFVRKKKIAFALEAEDTPLNTTGKDVEKAFIKSGHDAKYAKAQKKSYDAMLKDEKNNRLTEWE
ncbi:flavodoxin-dependent (E)-4-hydroxy-3-methylbut-2-enyl-diphosphate synthase [Candidatus Peregrinibacteria bacterium]|nr:flavodoxin-dependent (E)-4-hydroxy-3-methylbut-2-enyl-diphosphate synthase [Candidatus Peregrinibacteria bacterium]